MQGDTLLVMSINSRFLNGVVLYQIISCKYAGSLGFQNDAKNGLNLVKSFSGRVVD